MQKRHLQHLASQVVLLPNPALYVLLTSYCHYWMNVKVNGCRPGYVSVSAF